MSSLLVAQLTSADTMAKLAWAVSFPQEFASVSSPLSVLIGPLLLLRALMRVQYSWPTSSPAVVCVIVISLMIVSVMSISGGWSAFDSLSHICTLIWATFSGWVTRKCRI